MKRHRIAFVSTNAAVPWGGSEVLWSEAARQLAAHGVSVAASVHGWPQQVPEISRLSSEGIGIQQRCKVWKHLQPPAFRDAVGRMLRQTSPYLLGSWLAKTKPDLICISMGSPADNIALLKVCASSGIPYVTVVQANAECIWPDDDRAASLLTVFAGACRNYFVSKTNHALLESQLGTEVPNAEIVRNPYNVRRDVHSGWPASPLPIKLACVARLEPLAKGQDMLLRVLASSVWKARPVSLSLVGKGGNALSLRRLVAHLGLEDRVQFHGYVKNVEEIWASHHALVLPSRFEGLPLAMVEAMLCARPVIVTDVAGNSEVISDGETGFIAEAATVRHLDVAMQRAWDALPSWEAIGAAASKSIRTLLPKDPVKDFASKLAAILDSVSGREAGRSSRGCIDPARPEPISPAVLP